MAAAQQSLQEQQRAAAQAKAPGPTGPGPGPCLGRRRKADQHQAASPLRRGRHLLRDLQELAQREDQAQAFARRFTALREAHLRKPSLIARFDRAGLTL